MRDGKTPTEDAALIGVHATSAKFAVATSAIRENSWPDLEAVFTGQRSPRVMVQITRIVGYYSQLHNWNRSKLAELRDRHKGDYVLGEPENEEGDGCVKEEPKAEVKTPCGV